MKLNCSRFLCEASEEASRAILSEWPLAGGELCKSEEESAAEEAGEEVATSLARSLLFTSCLSRVLSRFRMIWSRFSPHIIDFITLPGEETFKIFLNS